MASKPGSANPGRARLQPSLESRADAGSAEASPSPKWTPQQKLAIETTGKSLLVSAAAGSGKTAVLAERCAYLVCDAPPPHRCDVDELLVVTFTNAAASEMRQ